MCTLAMYLGRFAGFPLVVAANRDEYLARAAETPHVLATEPRVVGGLDLQARGTWLAMSEHGLVSGLLNRRTETKREAPRSRGELPLVMLRAATTAEAEGRLEAIDPGAYRPFNLLVADREQAWVAQNREGRLTVTHLEPGVHVLTNLDVNDPRCPRIAHSYQAFDRVGHDFARNGDEAAFRTALGGILSDHTTALDPRQPDPLGAVCVHMGAYGTRCSSLQFLTADGRWRHWFADGPPCTTRYEPSPVP